MKAIRPALFSLALLGLALASLAGEEEHESDVLASWGRDLLGGYGCVGCHSAPIRVRERLGEPDAPRLDDVGRRIAPDHLRRFLLDPQLEKVGARMPDLLGKLSPDLRGQTVEALVHYLVSLGGPIDDRPFEVSLQDLEPGRELFHSVGCVACHEPQEAATDLEFPYWEFELETASGEPRQVFEAARRLRGFDSVALRGLARKTSVNALTELLLDPLAVWPSGIMPDMDLNRGEARDIALYLLREQALTEEALDKFEPGLLYDYYEADFDQPVPEFEQHVPVRTGISSSIGLLEPHADEHFGFHFKGFLSVPLNGLYTFWTSSDDGSRLSIDGTAVVHNGGLHAFGEASGQIRLSAGRHAIEIGYFEETGQEGLEVTWQGPDFERAELPAVALSHARLTFKRPDAQPFEIDPTLASLGRQLFDGLGCKACHGGGSPAEKRAGPGTELLALHPDATHGCLSDDPGAAPRFALEDSERRALREALNGDLEREPTPSEELVHGLRRLRCYACHERDGVGGPDRERRAYFVTLGAVDMGEEARVPPELDGVGGKLRRPWLSSVLLAGATARPYMATRMPHFGKENVAGLVELFVDLDAGPDDELEPDFLTEQVDDGRRLIGTEGGLGCIQCHIFAGYEALGTPAVDLADAHERLKPRWFKQLLLDPKSLDMNSRMPEFWVGGRSPVVDVLDGDPDRQIDAMWTYLSLARSAPLPPGLVIPEEEYELEASDRPLLCGVFMKDVSPRTLLVGFPEHTHYAFDVQGSRLAKVWRGRFFNAKGTWHGRAGTLEIPPSEDVFDLVAGPPFAILDDRDQPWPSAAPDESLARVLGRRLDPERRPIFRYAVGAIEIEELILPKVRTGGSWIERRFELRSQENRSDLWLRVAAGRELRQETGGEWVVEAAQRSRFRVRGGGAPQARLINGVRELIVPLDFEREGEGFAESIELEFTW